MAIGIDSILQSINNAVTAINKLTNQVKTTFPQASALSTSVTSGNATFTSSQASQFLTVVTSSGGSYKVPLYLP